MLVHGDSLRIIPKIKAKSINCIIADPPYFLSNGGTTNSGGKQVSVNKGDWDSGMTLAEKHKFNRSWIRRCKRILADDGTIWISGTLHNIYSIGMALEQEGFKIINNITWQKKNPPPNLACRNFTHSTETLLWAKKDQNGNKYFFNYDLMKEINNGKQMKDVWEGSLTPKSEKTFGKHPTQKPLYLIERVLQASTKQNDVVLDPFMGSGTTGVACKKLSRKFIGIEKDTTFIKLAKNRIERTTQEIFLL
nr:site-specific DNA-methyltransferase [Streptococcus constellatus]